MLADFRDHSLTALAGFVRDRRLSAEEMTAFALERIGALNGRLNAWAALDGDRALRDARALDARIAGGQDPGPLAGIPLAVKDMEDAAGFRTGYGSALHAEDPPAEQDSVQVARLRAAGCIVLGKTTTPEFGWYGETISPHWGVTSNPWNLERSPGGSSGGSAAALASGMVPLATGSDGGGSIRIPGSLCGLSVIKTTTGTIPLGGPVPPGAGVLAVRGPMTLRIADVAPALAACAGPDPSDPFSLPAQAIDWTGLAHAKTTIAVYMGGGAAPAVRDGLIAAGRDPRTPVAVVARGTRPDAESRAGRLAELAALAAETGEGPTLLVIGEVVARSDLWRAALERASRELAA